MANSTLLKDIYTEATAPDIVKKAAEPTMTEAQKARQEQAKTILSGRTGTSTTTTKTTTTKNPFPRGSFAYGYYAKYGPTRYEQYRRLNPALPAIPKETSEPEKTSGGPSSLVLGEMYKEATVPDIVKEQVEKETTQPIVSTETKPTETVEQKVDALPAGMSMPPLSPSIYDVGQPLEGRKDTVLSPVVERKIQEGLQTTPTETTSSVVSQEPPDDVITGREIKAKIFTDTLKGIQEKTSEIDPTAQYQLETGEILTGRELQVQIVKEGSKTISENVLRVSPGAYVEKEGEYYKFSPELSFLYSRSTPKTREKIVESLGVEPTSERTGFTQVTRSSYSELPDTEKEEYGYRFTEWSEVPPSDIQHRPGGKKYLSSVTPQEKERLVSSFLEEHKHGVDVFKYASEGGIWSGKKPSDPELRKEWAWEEITLSNLEQREKYWGKIPAPARWYSSTFQGAALMVTGFASLPHYVSKIVTGKAIGPDLTKIPRTGDVGYGVRGPGLIRTTVGETIGYVTGESPGLLERAKKRPIETFFATGGEIIGSYLLGKGISTVKTGTISGLGKTRSFIQTRTGLNLPSYAQISYHYPTRYARRWWVQRGTKNIDDVIGKPYHSTDVLTEKGLSYAPGKTIGGRISWTKKQLFESKKLGFDDEFLVGSGSGQRIGRRFIIKEKSIHELPGLSTAPYGSTPTRFYRFGSPPASYSTGTTLFPRGHLPTGLAVPLKKIVDPIRGSYDDIATWAAKQQKGSWGMVGPKMLKGGPETEVNIFGRTVLKRYLPGGTRKTIGQRIRGYQYYTDVPLGEAGYFSGKQLIEKVPIVFTRPVGGGLPSGVSSIGRTIIERTKRVGLSSSSLSEPSTSVFNIYSIGSSIPIGLQKSSASSSYSIEPFYSSKPLSFDIESSLSYDPYTPTPSISTIAGKSSRTSSKPSSLVSISASSPSSSLPSSPSSNTSSYPSSVPSSVPISISIPSSPSSSQPSSTPSIPSSPSSPISQPSSTSIPSSSIGIDYAPSYPSYPYLPEGKKKRKKDFTEIEIFKPIEGARKKKHPITLLFKELYTG